MSEQENEKSGGFSELMVVLLLLGIGSAGYSYSRDFRSAVDFVVIGGAILALLAILGWIGKVLGFIDASKKDSK